MQTTNIIDIAINQNMSFIFGRQFELTFVRIENIYTAETVCKWTPHRTGPPSSNNST